MEDGQRQEIVKAVERAMNSIYEAKVDIAKGSYEDPYPFTCTKTLAKIIRKAVQVDKNNIFISNDVYFKLCIQEPLRDATLEVVARTFEKAKNEVK